MALTMRSRASLNGHATASRPHAMPALATPMRRLAARQQLVVPRIAAPERATDSADEEAAMFCFQVCETQGPTALMCR
jgi:hypothetical protein